MGAATNVVGTCGALCLFIGTNRLAPSWLRRGRVFRRMSLVDTTPSAPPPHTQPRGGAFLATTATRHHRQLGPKSETWDRVSGLGPCLDGSLWAEGRYDRFQNWRADLICRMPTIIPTPSSVAATLAARTQTSPKQGSPIIAQCVNLEHEFHHDASKVRIFRFEPFNQSLMIRIPLRCFRIPHRLTSTLTYKL